MNILLPTIYLLDSAPRRGGGDSAHRAILGFLDPGRYSLAGFDTIDGLLEADRVKRGDLLLLNLSPEDGDGFRALSTLVGLERRRPVICLEREPAIPTVVAAIKAGAFHFLSTARGGEEFRAVVDEALAARKHLPKQDHHRRELQARHEQLTRREREVFSLVIEGLPNKQIAAKLEVALQTVKIHRARVMGKMAAASAVELLQFAQVLGCARRFPKAASLRPPHDPRSPMPGIPGMAELSDKKISSELSNLAR